MNKFLPFILVAGAIVCPLSAQETAAPPAAAEQPATPTVAEALQQVEQQNSEDFYPVVTALLATQTAADMPAAMQQAAEQGSAAALYWVSRRAVDKLSVEGADLVNDPRAKTAWEQMKTAAEKGYLPAKVELSRYAGSGIGRAADENEGTQLLMDACKAGSVRARAAYLLVSGRLDKAENWTAPEVVSELKKNNFYLEEILASLCGDEKLSLSWLKSAAEHGSANAPFLLSQMYAPELSQEDFKNYLLMAANRHLPDALAALGIAEALGNGQLVPLSKEQSIRHLEESYALGSMAGVVALAMQYHADAEHYKPERVFDLFRTATELGEVNAAVSYAYCLAAGYGCTAEPARGAAMLKQLADAGMAYAHVALASLYFNGQGGLEADLHQAVIELVSAGSQGIPGTYTIAAALTAMGNSKTKPDERRAASYLKMAEEQGGTTARAEYEAILAAKAWNFMMSTN